MIGAECTTSRGLHGGDHRAAPSPPVEAALPALPGSLLTRVEAILAGPTDDPDARRCAERIAEGLALTDPE